MDLSKSERQQIILKKEWEILVLKRDWAKEDLKKDRNNNSKEENYYKLQEKERRLYLKYLDKINKNFKERERRENLIKWKLEDWKEIDKKTRERILKNKYGSSGTPQKDYQILERERIKQEQNKKENKGDAND